MKQQDSRQAAESVIKALLEAGHVALLAGGCVRDMLLSRVPKDYDVVTDALPDRVVELFKRTEQVGAKFGVVLVRLHGHQIEVATFRADGTYTDGRHPDAVVFGNEIDDAKRRDFTINGMFYDTAGKRIIDHVGGQQDIEARLIRAIGNPQRRFAEDHLRMLRAVRFAARFDFEIEPATAAAIRTHAHRLPAISPERIREELKLILTPPHRELGWRLIVSTGLVDHLMPPLQWREDETAAVGKRLEALHNKISFSLALAALLVRVEPSPAETACRGLRCPTTESKAVLWLLRNLPRVRRQETLDLADLKLLMADPRFDDLMALLRACLEGTGASASSYDRLTERSAEIDPQDVSPAPFVTGDDLVERDLPRGPVYATLLDKLYRAQLNQEITNRHAALERLDDLIQVR